MFSKLPLGQFRLAKLGIYGFLTFSLLCIFTAPAWAHHAFDNQLPKDIFQGFLSGLAHPMIGLDHFAFVVAIGLLSALKPRGFFLPIVFVIAAMVGTGIHLLGMNLPLPEIIIATSVLGFGIMLALRESPSLLIIGGSSAIAGIFHGYAYGESIVGAQVNPLLAYLTGFTVMQLIIALMAYKIGQFSLKKLSDSPQLPLRFAGFMISGIGTAFLANAILG